MFPFPHPPSSPCSYSFKYSWHSSAAGCLLWGHILYPPGGPQHSVLGKPKTCDICCRGEMGMPSEQDLVPTEPMPQPDKCRGGSKEGYVMVTGQGGPS